jgi:hypothetical protein
MLRSINPSPRIGSILEFRSPGLDLHALIKDLVYLPLRVAGAMVAHERIQSEDCLNRADRILICK